MSLGFSISHFLKPKTNDHSLLNSSAADLPWLSNLHGQFNVELTDKWTLSPQFYYQSFSGANEIAVQAWTGYQLNDDYRLRGGAGYRLGDAAEILLGVDYKDLRVQAAYDINMNSLTGSFEIAAWYIIKIYKKPVVKPAILCPRL